jgi:dolichol-phosphate mannosyltransferase
MDCLYVIAPVYNETENIPALMRNWARLSACLADSRITFVLVDDGSTDGTVETIATEKQNLDVLVLRHDENRGPGYAFGTAFAHLAGDLKPDDILVTMEGDNTSRIATLLRMLERCRREDLDFVLASPYAYGGGFMRISLWRRFLSHGANGTLRGIIGMHGIHTMSSFFRVCRGRAIQSLQANYDNRIIESAGFEGMVEMLKKIMILGLSVSEVPMLLNSQARVGKSKMKILRTIFGYLKLCVVMKRWKRAPVAAPMPDAEVGG